MVYRTSLILVLVFSLLIGCAWMRYVYVFKEDEEAHGVWIPRDGDSQIYPFARPVSKMVLHTNGAVVYYSKGGSDVRPFYIVDKWIDSEGDVFYHVYIPGWANSRPGEREHYWIIKVSNSGTVLEAICGYRHFGELPTKINPKDSTYAIYDRQR